MKKFHIVHSTHRKHFSKPVDQGRLRNVDCCSRKEAMPQYFNFFYLNWQQEEHFTWRSSVHSYMFFNTAKYYKTVSFLMMQMTQISSNSVKCQSWTTTLMSWLSDSLQVTRQLKDAGLKITPWVQAQRKLSSQETMGRFWILTPRKAQGDKEK